MQCGIYRKSRGAGISGQSAFSLGKDSMMVKFEDIQSYGKEQFEQAVANATTFLQRSRPRPRVTMRE